MLSEKSRVKVGCFEERLIFVSTLPTRRLGSTPRLCSRRGTGRRRGFGRGGVHEAVGDGANIKSMMMMMIF